MRIPNPIKRLPKRLKRGLKHPSVMAMTVKFGVQVGHETYRFRNAEIDYDEFKRRTIAHIGEISGTTLGAAVGGIAGSWVPGIGALFGAFAGSMVGEMVGEHLGRRSALGVHGVLKRNGTSQNAPGEPEAPDHLRPPRRQL